ncbi:MAG TPA: HAD family phosphatase [Solirubrobacteraceae bacterium]
MISVVVSDFGGVLTNPLWEAFEGVNAALGIPPRELNTAITALTAETGTHPLHALERGEMSEHDFLSALDRHLTEALGRPSRMLEFSEHYFEGLSANQPMLEELAALQERGYRLALLTNNVREWEPRWRAMFPVDALFEVVVDSAFVGMRKPEPEIYELMCSRLGVEAGACVLVDDFAVNCEGAREAGMHAVRFESNDQTLGELRALLSEQGVHG